MKKSDRRRFLKTVALAAGGASQAEGFQAPVAPAASETPAKPAAQVQSAIQYPRTFAGRQLERIAFPLGGVAAGSVGLGGRGQLLDWEIFNRPDKGKSISYAFPSIWAQAGKSKPIARVLEARLMPPYEAGSGLSPNQVSGLTRLEDATFTGEYPLAKIAFHDRDLPVKVALEAFTPIIPLDADESGLPMAVLRYVVTNTGKEAAKVSIAFSIENAAGVDLRGAAGRRALMTSRTTEYRSAADLHGLFMTNPETAAKDPLAGSLAIALLGAADGKVTYLRGWPRAKWWTSPLLFWDDFSDDGQLGPEAQQRNPSARSACNGLAPGAKAEYTFLLAWHFPNRTPAWSGWGTPPARPKAKKTPSSATITAPASRTPGRQPNTQRPNYQISKRVLAVSSPPCARVLCRRVCETAAMANLSTLVSQPVFRTADGEFHGFEGYDDHNGCCFGNCTHVWNYETSTQYLFPTLARSLRKAAFGFSEDEQGAMRHSPDAAGWQRTLRLCRGRRADGSDHEGLSGLAPFRRHRLAARHLAQSEARLVLRLGARRLGCQTRAASWMACSTTPTTWSSTDRIRMCGIYYLGALRAAEEMARAVGDRNRCRGSTSKLVRISGSKWIDANLFNGQYYVQKVASIPKSTRSPRDRR